MTLKTFHFAGVASMNITLGVPRIKEIINATKDISTPIISATLVNESDLVAARIVKGRIETTVLGDIAEYITEVYTPQGCFISVKLDQETIQKLRLELDIEAVKTAIVKHRKLKVQEKHITIVKGTTLNIEPHDTSRDKMYFALQQIKSQLPLVVVKGIPSISRAVISLQEECTDTRYRLLAEGTGLEQVMRTPGVVFQKSRSNHIMEVE